MNAEGSSVEAFDAPVRTHAAPLPRERNLRRVRAIFAFTIERRFAVLALFSFLACVSSWLVQTNPPRVAVALFAGIALGTAILFEPFLGILAYYNLAFMRPQDLLWGLQDARLTFFTSTFTLFATLIHVARRPTLRALRSPQTFLVAILWLFIYLSTEFGAFAVPQAKWMDYYNKMFLIYFIGLLSMNSEKKLLATCWVIALSVGCLALWANDQHYVQGLAVVHGPGAEGSTLYDHNDFAMLLVMTLPFYWHLMRYSKNGFLKLLNLALLPLAAHAIMVTFSRGGFLGMVAIVLTIVFRERRKALGAILIALGVGFFVILAGDSYRHRIGSIDDYQEERSASGRLEAWEVGVRMTVQNPVFGVGLQRFTDAFPHYSKWDPRVAHNSWVQLMAECGLIALSCYGGLVALTVLSLRRIRKRIAALPAESALLTSTLVSILEAALVGYLVCGFFLSMEDFEYFYLLVAMTQVLDRTSGGRVRESSIANAPSAAAPNLCESVP
jgi:probable O-glycosylation ligase (exosortase A-associated)